MADLNQVAVELAAGAARIGALGSMVLRKSALDIEATAKQMCPVDTGNLRASITHEFTGDGRLGTMQADIGPTAEYGAYVEYGTARQSPQAYMGPAFDRHSPLFVAAVEQLTRQALP